MENKMYYIHKHMMPAFPNADYKFIKNVTMYEERFIQKYDPVTGVFGSMFNSVSIFEPIDKEWLLSEYLKGNIYGKFSFTIDLNDIERGRLFDIQTGKTVTFTDAYDTLYGFHD